MIIIITDNRNNSNEKVGERTKNYNHTFGSHHKNIPCPAGFISTPTQL